MTALSGRAENQQRHDKHRAQVHLHAFHLSGVMKNRSTFLDFTHGASEAAPVNNPVHVCIPTPSLAVTDERFWLIQLHTHLLPFEGRSDIDTPRFH